MDYNIIRILSTITDYGFMNYKVSNKKFDFVTWPSLVVCGEFDTNKLSYNE